ncbi:hypothetical protein AFCA_011304 [Aspergillus flavus]|nr:hypothetical protein AFCA_011304 [Aspergillus flavus]
MRSASWPWALRLTTLVSTPAGELPSTSKPWCFPSFSLEFKLLSLDTKFNPRGDLSIHLLGSQTEVETKYGFRLGGSPEAESDYRYSAAINDNTVQFSAEEVVDSQRDGILHICLVLLTRSASLHVRSRSYYICLSVPAVQDPVPMMSDLLGWPICRQSGIVFLPDSSALKPFFFVAASSYNEYDDALLTRVFVQNPTGSHLIDTILSSEARREGSALATCSRSNLHREVFFITQNGAIQGRV